MVLDWQLEPDSKTVVIPNRLCVQSDCTHHGQVTVSFMIPRRKALCTPDGPQGLFTTVRTFIRQANHPNLAGLAQFLFYPRPTNFLPGRQSSCSELPAPRRPLPDEKKGLPAPGLLTTCLLTKEEVGRRES